MRDKEDCSVLCSELVRLLVRHAVRSDVERVLTKRISTPKYGTEVTQPDSVSPAGEVIMRHCSTLVSYHTLRLCCLMLV